MRLKQKQTVYRSYPGWATATTNNDQVGWYCTKSRDRARQYLSFSSPLWLTVLVPEHGVPDFRYRAWLRVDQHRRGAAAEVAVVQEDLPFAVNDCLEATDQRVKQKHEHRGGGWRYVFWRAAVSASKCAAGPALVPYCYRVRR